MILSSVVVVVAVAVLPLLFAPISAQDSCGASKGTGVYGALGVQMGPHVQMGPTKSEIVRMETVFTPGRRPKIAKGIIFLWPGINDQSKRTSGDLIQTVAEGYKGDCGDSKGMWCLRPYVMHGTGYSSPDKTGVPIAADSQIKITYHKTEDGSQWVQNTVDMKTGKQLHNFISGKGSPKGWGTGTELQGGNPGTIDTQYYVNTTITLSAPDASFKATHAATGKGTSRVVSSGLVTTDNKVFKIAKITIPPWTAGC